MSKKIKELSDGVVSSSSMFRAYTGTAEDIKTNSDGVTRTMLAEKVMQGVHVELAKSVTNNKRNLSIILSAKGQEVSQTAPYTDFENAIKALEVADPYTTTIGCSIVNNYQAKEHANALNKSYSAVVYLQSRHLAVAFAASKTVDLYTVTQEEDNLVYTKVYTLTIPEIDFSNKTFSTCYSLRGNYVCITFWERSSSDVKTNFILRVNSDNTLDKVELTTQQAEWLGTKGICSIDDTFTMIGVFYDMGWNTDPIAIDLQNGPISTEAAVQRNTDYEFWLTATTMVTCTTAGTAWVVRFIDGVAYAYKLIDHGGVRPYLVDIPEKQKALLVFVGPSGQNYDYLFRNLTVGVIDYFTSQTANIIYSGLDPVTTGRTTEYSSVPTNAYTLPIVTKYDNGYLVLLPAYLAFMSFQINEDLTAVTFPVFSGSDRTMLASPNECKASFLLGNNLYSIFGSSTIYINSYNVALNQIDSLYYKNNTFKLVK